MPHISGLLEHGGCSGPCLPIGQQHGKGLAVPSERSAQHLGAVCLPVLELRTREGEEAEEKLGEVLILNPTAQQDQPGARAPGK